MLKKLMHDIAHIEARHTIFKVSMQVHNQASPFKHKMTIFNVWGAQQCIFSIFFHLEM